MFQAKKGLLFDVERAGDVELPDCPPKDASAALGKIGVHLFQMTVAPGLDSAAANSTQLCRSTLATSVDPLPRLKPVPPPTPLLIWHQSTEWALGMGRWVDCRCPQHWTETCAPSSEDRLIAKGEEPTPPVHDLHAQKV